MLPSNLRKSIGIALGGAMIVFVLWASLVGTSASASTVPAQTQYNTPTTNNSGLPVADYAIIGVVIAIIVAGLLYFMLFGRKGGAAPSDDEASGGDSDSKSEESSEKSEEESSDSKDSDFHEDDDEDSSGQ